jgi:WD40 repeat protein
MRRVLVFLVLAASPWLASCALNPPRIISILPSREVTDVPTNQAVSITFDRPMNHASVEQRFELAPSIGGCNSGCHYAWSGNTFMYLHAVNFAIYTQYTVSMHSGYADESGQQNTLEHVWHFTTEKAPALSTMDPADGASGVAPDRNLVLSFDRPMRTDSIRQAVKLTPATPFLLRGRPGGDGSQYAIVPLSSLQPNQVYTLAIDRALDVHGNPLSARINAHFKTGALTLSRKIGFLMGQKGEAPFAIGIVDPHPDPFLQRSTPKQVYSLGQQSRLTDGLLGFDWSPDGNRLAVIDAPRNASTGPIQIVDVSSGTAIRPGISGSDVYWAADGLIVYLKDGILYRFDPVSLSNIALTDPADGRVVAPVALSPDGKSAAYSTIDAQAINHLWIMNMELRTRYRPVGLDDPADHPAWAPNGTKLSFRRISSGRPELWIYDLSSNGGAAYRRITALDITGSAWLNDNSTLIVATGAGSSAALYRVNIFSAGEAGGVVKVTGVKAAPNGSQPSIPVYDRRIAFVAEVDALPQIFVMNGDGSRPQQLTGTETDLSVTGTAPNWTPGG